MLSPKTPGVYIQEISTLPSSIAPVATAIPAFIGYTQSAMLDGVSLTGVPTRITSLLEFREWFGGPQNEALTLTITDNYDADDTLITRKFKATLPAPSAYKLYYSLQMYFNNGGGPCYIVSVGNYTQPVIPGDGSNTFPAGGLIGGINAVEKVDEPTLLVYPDTVSLGDETLYGSVVQAALAQCEKLKDRFTIADVKLNGTPSEISDYRGALGLSNLKYGAAYHPFIKSTLNYGYEDTLTVSHTTTGGTPPPAIYDTMDLSTLSASHPSIYRSVIASISELYVDLPPSGAIAGIYARVDNEKGVWKAPANVSMRSVIEPTINITNQMQDDLNVDPSTGKSINAIRAFTGKGILVWGARTLAGNDNEWRYVPVRRLFIFIEESVLKATEFVVFEPNNANTWVRVKSMIENFLTKLWRDGALAGATTEDAFFVRVGLGETMTSQDILEGRMNIEIGLAAVRPAEFIILKFSHKLQES